MKRRAGQSIIEVLIAITVFAIIISAMSATVLQSAFSVKQAEYETKAYSLLQEGFEAVRAIRNYAYNNLFYNQSGVLDSGIWQFKGEGTTDTIDEFTRIITIDDVYRNSVGDIVLPTDPQAVLDAETKKIVISVSWPSMFGITRTISEFVYLTNWNSLPWTQTDWSGGDGQAIWLNETRYDNDDGNIDNSVAGQISLVSGGSGGMDGYSWDFDVATDYSYDSSKIKVENSVANLIASESGLLQITGIETSNWGDAYCYEFQIENVSGSTIYGWQIDFDVVDFSIYNSWDGNFILEADHYTVLPTYNHIINAGETLDNIGFCADILGANYLPNNVEVSTFTYSSSDVSFEILEGSNWGTGYCANIAVTNNTSETIYWWSGLFNFNDASLTSTWNAQYENLYDNTYQVSSESWNSTILAGETISSPGYCADINGPNYIPTVEEVVLPVNYAYPSDNPDISPIDSFEVLNIYSWLGFYETAQKNGGEIYYQLSDDDGVTWYYWDGVNWSVAGASDYNTALQINSNLANFPIINKKINFKAFLSSDGTQQVELDKVEITYSQGYVWDFDEPSDYVYDDEEIEVVSSYAQLSSETGSCAGTPNACGDFADEPLCLAQSGCSWTAGSSQSTLNSGFTSNADNWTYSDWEEQGNRVVGTWASGGGNPGGYVDIRINNGRNSTLSGYWYQGFTTTVDNPTNATVDLDWRILSYNSGGLVSYILYAFVDNYSGNPVVGTQVWSQTITGISPWASAPTIDVSSKLTTAGTYYLKIAARRIQSNANGGLNRAGFDNVILNWTGASICSGTPDACSIFDEPVTCAGQSGCLWSAGSYSTAKPTVYPTSSLVVPSVDAWLTFEETAQKNGGEIYYQLSDDNGITWYYWNGIEWSEAGETDYNTASIVNDNIAMFDATAKRILFKAFLESDGTQFVRLDAVNISYSGGTGGVGYSLSGQLESSAFNTGSQSNFNVISWQEDLPNSNYQIKVQIKTAPDDAGSPGEWSQTWCGPDGDDGDELDFYTQASGALIHPNHNGDQWIKYLVTLLGDGEGTPILQEITINYTNW